MSINLFLIEYYSNRNHTNSTDNVLYPRKYGNNPQDYCQDDVDDERNHSSLRPLPDIPHTICDSVEEDRQANRS